LAAVQEVNCSVKPGSIKPANISLTLVLGNLAVQQEHDRGQSLIGLGSPHIASGSSSLCGIARRCFTNPVHHGCSPTHTRLCAPM